MYNTHSVEWVFFYCLEGRKKIVVINFVASNLFDKKAVYFFCHEVGKKEREALLLTLGLLFFMSKKESN